MPIKQVFFNIKGQFVAFLQHRKKIGKFRVLDLLLTCDKQDTLTLDKLGIELTLFPSRSCQSLSLKTLKKRWDLISWASLGPPPSLLAGSLTRSPSKRSRASLEMLTLRGNLTSSTNMLPENINNNNSLKFWIKYIDNSGHP